MDKNFDSLVLKAILGEAEGEPYEGKVAIGEALRRRGHTKGVYGINAVYEKNGKWFRKSKKGGRMIPPNAISDAMRAAEESRKSRLVDGAKNWENVEQFGYPIWAKSMKKIKKIGRHTFYQP